MPIYKYYPRFIVFWAASRYMTSQQVESFRQFKCKNKRLTVKMFVAELSQHFSVDMLLRSPQVREDAWMHHYLIYYCKQGFARLKLIRPYEREIILPVEKNFQELLGSLNEILFTFSALFMNHEQAEKVNRKIEYSTPFTYQYQ